MRHDLVGMIDQIASEFFLPSFPIRVGVRVEGAALQGYQMVLGCKVGPQISHVNLAHEMAHFVEIDDARIVKSGWGLRVPKVTICGIECVEPRTTQMTEREIRVIAYQANLLEYLGASETVDDTIRSLHFMPDFMLIPLENGIHPFSEEGIALGVPYEEVDKSRTRWISNRVDAARKVCTMEKFLSEWFRKLSVLPDLIVDEVDRWRRVLRRKG